LLTSKIIRQRVGGRKKTFKMEKSQNGASIRKTDHAKIRSMLIKHRKFSYNPKNSVQSPKACTPVEGNAGSPGGIVFRAEQ
jgi:hypothetical protein